MGKKLDWNDPKAVGVWLEGLRSALEDYDVVVDDMLRPPRQRELGPEKHRELAAAARDVIRVALDFADRMKAPAPTPEERGMSASS